VVLKIVLEACHSICERKSINKPMSAHILDIYGVQVVGQSLARFSCS